MTANLGRIRARRFSSTVAGVVACLVMSGVVMAVPAVAAAPPSTSIDPRDVPLLPGASPLPRPGVPANSGADFTPLTGNRSSHFDAKRSQPVSQSMFATEYVNPDGTHTVRQSAQPQNVKDANGKWQPVDTGLDTDA